MYSVVIPENLWRERQERHHARLSPFLEEHRRRRFLGIKHPVWDFFFEYYSFKTSHLLRWTPNLGEVLENGDEFLELKGFSIVEGGVTLDLTQFPAHRITSLRDALNILIATSERPATHGCFGLHEWAMVYRCPNPRHDVSLRLSGAEIAAFVESQTIRCSHYDAFRFFTPEAVPLNILNPSHHNRAEFEQPGCIHANMDLYKMAYKWSPWSGAELLADAFEVAKEARHLDMCAAPYDLREFGFEPVRIETNEGRVEYVQRQRDIATKAAPIRSRLIEVYKELLEKIETP
jgi:hypothetical protein